MTIDEGTAAGSANGRIFKAAAVIGAATLIVRLFGLVKNQAIAAQFGMQFEVEAFLVAAVWPTFAFGVLANSLPSALVPAYVRVRRQEGDQVAARLASGIGGWSIILLLGLTVVLGLFWPAFLAVVGREFSEEKRALATELFYILLPSLVVHGLASIWASFLNARKRFLVPVLAPGLIPICIALLVFLAAARWGAYALAVGHLLGVVLELGLVGAAAQAAGLPIRPTRPRGSPEVRAVLQQYLPVLGGRFLMSSTLVVDQTMAAMLPAGSLVVLTYAQIVVAALLAVGAMALGTAILPYLSDMAQARDRKGIRTSLRLYALLVVLVSVPVTFVAVLMARPIASVIYERGAFAAEDTEAVGSVMVMYSLQVPFFAVGILCARVISSLGKNECLMRVAALNLVVNIGLNLAFIPWLGAAGIALSTACVYFISSGVLWILAHRALRTIEDVPA